MRETVESPLREHRVMTSRMDHRVPRTDTDSRGPLWQAATDRDVDELDDDVNKLHGVTAKTRKPARPSSSAISPRSINAVTR
jgi:hypothetical protein